MTTQRRYTCNLCRDNINIDPVTGVGVFFVSGTRYIEFRTVDNSENHLCKACLKALHEQAGDALMKLAGK